MQGWWFSPGTPASSTTKTGRHDIAEILLKVALDTKIHSNSKLVNLVYVLTFIMYASSPMIGRLNNRVFGAGKLRQLSGLQNVIKRCMNTP